MVEIIVQYFKVKYNNKEERQKEINLCLKKNIENKYVNTIHFLYESEEDFEYFKPLINKKVNMYSIKKRLSYQTMLDYANKYLKNKVCVYLHADMYLTDDFGFYQFKNNYMYSLTSHHPKKCNKTLNCKCTRQFNTPKGLYGVTFDGFVFTSPVNVNTNDFNYLVNHMGAENRFIYLFKKNNYTVVCPNKDLRAIHVHQTIFHNRKDWIDIDGNFKPMEYYCNIHKKQKKKKIMMKK